MDQSPCKLHTDESTAFNVVEFKRNSSESILTVSSIKLLSGLYYKTLRMRCCFEEIDQAYISLGFIISTQFKKQIFLYCLWDLFLSIQDFDEHTDSPPAQPSSLVADLGGSPSSHKPYSLPISHFV